MVKKLLMVLVGALFLVPLCVQALSGNDANRAKIKLYAEKNDVWFRAGTDRADEDGVLKIKDVMPGWYRFKTVDKDFELGQSVAAKIRMLDADGRRIDHDTEVDLYVKMNGEEVFIRTEETDEDGWIELNTLYPNETEYKLDIDEREDSSLGHKDGKVRIKIKANVLDYSSGEWTDWFRAGYKRTDANRVLEAKGVLPARYKFSYKDQDSPPTVPFTLHARMLDKDGAEIKEPTTFLLYYEVDDVLNSAGAVTSDDDGWVTVPGLLPDVTYKVDML